MNKNPAFLVTLVAAIVMAIGLSIVTILYVLSRRSLAEARATLRAKEEQLVRFKEEQTLTITEEVKRQLAAKIAETERQIEALKAASQAADQRAASFDQAIDRVKSWNDLRVTK